MATDLKKTHLYVTCKNKKSQKTTEPKPFLIYSAKPLLSLSHTLKIAVVGRASSYGLLESYKGRGQLDLKKGVPHRVGTAMEKFPFPSPAR